MGAFRRCRQPCSPASTQQRQELEERQGVIPFAEKPTLAVCGRRPPEYCFIHVLSLLMVIIPFFELDYRVFRVCIMSAEISQEERMLEQRKAEGISHRHRSLLDAVQRRRPSRMTESPRQASKQERQTERLRCQHERRHRAPSSMQPTQPHPHQRRREPEPELEPASRLAAHANVRMQLRREKATTAQSDCEARNSRSSGTRACTRG